MGIAALLVLISLSLPFALGHGGGSSVASGRDVQVTTSPASATAPRVFTVSPDCVISGTPATSAYILLGAGLDGAGRPTGHFGLLQFNVGPGDQIDGRYTLVQFTDYGTPHAPESPDCTTVNISGKVDEATRKVSLRVDGEDLRGSLSDDRLDSDSPDSLSPVVTSTWDRVSGEDFKKTLLNWGAEHRLQRCSANPATACKH
jgi:hypothetical protein